MNSFAYVSFLVAAFCCSAYAGPVQSLDVSFIGQQGNKTFYAGNNATNYNGAEAECRAANMTLATLENTGEYGLVQALIGEGIRFHVWLGGRSLQTQDLFEWTESKQPLGDFVSFYNYVEEGFMGLTMNRDVGSSLHAVYSEKVGPVALCQKIE